MPENKRETGARVLTAKTKPDSTDEVSRAAAANKPPKGIGNSEPVADSEAKTRHSEGVNPRHPSPQQKAGAGPALTRHSRDA